MNSIPPRKSLIGLPMKEAQKIYHPIRQVVINHKPIIVTMEYCSQRINVETMKGIIVRIDGFY